MSVYQGRGVCMHVCESLDYIYVSECTDWQSFVVLQYRRREFPSCLIITGYFSLRSPPSRTLPCRTSGSWIAPRVACLHMNACMLISGSSSLKLACKPCLPALRNGTWTAFSIIIGLESRCFEYFHYRSESEKHFVYIIILIGSFFMTCLAFNQPNAMEKSHHLDVGTACHAQENELMANIGTWNIQRIEL